MKKIMFLCLFLFSSLAYSGEVNKTIDDLLQNQRIRNLNFFMIDYKDQMTDLECLSLAVYHEARGESMLGMTAVAFVIHNRVSLSIKRQEKNKEVPWGTTICETIFQDRQFSFISDKHPDSVLYIDVYEKIVKLSYDLLYNGGFSLKSSPVGKAYYFNALENPYEWRYHEHYEYIATIGNHHFYGNK
jgi:hypothetical protein